MKKEINDLDLGRFSERIDKSLLTLNDDGTYDYDGGLSFFSMGLKSLLEIPIRFRRIGGDFYCRFNKLLSLEGCPILVGGNFSCSQNNLISLQYGPLEVGESFECSWNNLLSEYQQFKVGFVFISNPNPFSITNYVIKAIKEMTIDQRVAELKFFKKYDLKAYEMMLKAMNENDIGYGPKAKEMLEITNGYNISNLI